MVWFRVDDGFARSKRVLSIPRARRAAAVGVWLLAGSWASAELTDGFVPNCALDEVPSASKCKRDLIDSGLWSACDGGIQFRNWHDFNPVAEDVEADRARNAARQKAYRERKQAERDAVSNASRNALRNGGLTAPSVTVPRPDPTRPDPTVVPTELLKPSPTVREPRGKRIDPNWQPSQRLIAWAKSECPTVDGRAETPKFVDWWVQKSGKDALKAEWDAAFRTWMRRTRDQTQLGNRPISAGQAGASRPSTTDQRVNDGMAVVRRLAEREAKQDQLQIGAA